MPRTLGYPVRRIALLSALTFLVGALLVHAIHRPRQDSVPALPTAAAAPIVATAPAPAEPATPAAHAQTPAPAKAATTPAMPYGSAGMVVGIDPETGKLGLPSKADRAALERAANLSPALDRSDVGLTVIHKPDGSRMVDLQGRFQDYMVVRIAPDGRKIESCVEGPEVEKALEGAAAPSDVVAPAPSSEPRYEER